MNLAIIAQENSPPASRLFSQMSPLLLLSIMLAVGLLLAPFFQNEFDVQTCWGWAQVSGGSRPWNMYLLRADCNYPPLILYILAVLRVFLDALAWRSDSLLGVGLIKVPNLIAFALMVWLVRASLRPIVGITLASATACVCALCLPLWFDAAIWGQWEAFLCLAMVGAVVALWRKKPVWCGLAIGCGLSVKPAAIMIVPALLVYCLRRLGLRAVIRLIAVAVIAWGVLAAPFFIAGAGHGVEQAYADTVGRYSLYSVGAFNAWGLMQTRSAHARRWVTTIGRPDAETVFGLITARQAGIALFATYLAFVLWGLWRRPTDYNFIFAAGLSAYAFFMLPTEVHERYLLPACALFSLIAVRGAGLTYLAIAVPALINEVIALWYENSQGRGELTVQSYHAFQTCTLVFSSINVLLFLWITWKYLRVTLTAPSSTLSG